MKQILKEWLSIQVAKRPRRTILGSIILFNILLVICSAVVISSFAMSGTEKMHFFEAAFCTLTMILDPGCIQFVVADIGKAGVAISIICLLTVITGMITFTGAVIGYTTNSISEFIQHSDTGKRKLEISEHVVILNWNTRASEIVNDLLYCKTKQKVVILVKSGKAEIEKEIAERLSDTISRENKMLIERCKEMLLWERWKCERKEWFKNNVTVIVREGDIYSSRQLKDICLEKAKTVIILGNERNNSICQYDKKMREEVSKGNSQTIKTLMQVADITAADYSSDDQKIIVEITDEWTSEVVDKIIKYKQKEGKCNIVPLHINQVLGQILSQFSLMPELNLAYEELFSNRGATFFSHLIKMEDEEQFIKSYLKDHRHAIPLTIMEKNGKRHAYYVAESEKHLQKISTIQTSDYQVKLNHDYWIEQKKIIILGHNSHCKEIMEGFQSFRNEWNYKSGEGEILSIVIIDDEEHLKKMDYYREYPFVIETVVADVYDKDIICSKIEEFVDEHEEDTSILILSDDAAENDEIDANAMANLVYIQDIIRKKKMVNPDFDENKMDVIVEIINPKHHDIVRSYSIHNVVISNRYISKMITQIGEKEDLFEFYTDILQYDDEEAESYVSKEVYIKKVSRLFTEIPGPCTVEEFIRKTYEASVDASLPKEKYNPSIPLGYIKADGKMVLFSGNQAAATVELSNKDKLVMFSNH